MNLSPALDQTTGCVVLHDSSGDIKLIIPNGKMRVERLGVECDKCLADGLEFAKQVAEALSQFTTSAK
jgi:hypothetical protein